MKIVVTGGAGFIGTNMLIALRKRYPNSEIVSVDIRVAKFPVEGVNYVLTDVRDRDNFYTTLRGTDKVFHLAAIIGTHESFHDVENVITTNILGTINLLDYIKSHKDTEMYIAGMPGVWNNPYSISKDTALRMALSYYETYRIKFTAFRWFSVYGPYQYVSRYNKAVPTFIVNALNNTPIPIYGTGKQVSDFIYVEDAVNLAIDSLEQENWGKIVECASGDGISVNDLALKIIDLTESKSKLEHLNMRQGEPEGAIIVAKTEVLKKLYDRDLVSLDEGLHKTIDFYKSNSDID